MYLKQGHRLHNDKYQLLNILGEGGFSLTYRGAWSTEVQGNLGKVPTYVPVCIKEYFFKDYCYRNPKTNFVETNSTTGNDIFNKNKEKIIKEARILSEINHPNVVNVLEVFKQNNTVYIVMEFISGHSLKSEVERNGLFTEEKLKKIIFKIGQALDYIHEKNILHLDIKPSNILIDQKNNPKLIDFGISKKYDLFNDQETSTALLAASKGYASIEQYDSEGIQVFSPRPDIYSLGATMYYLVTGQVPTESILRSTKGLQNPGEINPEISENTENVILKAMALNPADRYESVMNMLLDLGFNPETDKIDLSKENFPEYPEITTNVNDEPYDFDIEDETIIHTKEIKSKKWKKKYGWLFLLIPFFVSGIMALVLFSGIWKKTPFIPVEISQTVVNENDTIDNNQTLLSDVIPQDTVKPGPEPVTVDIQTTSPEEAIEANYLKSFKEAELAFNNKEYTRSLELFNQAESYKKTIDTERYKTLIAEEKEKEEIENRKKGFRDFKKIGNFVVVRDELTDKFGARDEKGFLKIPCKYLNLDQSTDDFLFQREDNQYDKYDPISGELLGIIGLD